MSSELKIEINDNEDIDVKTKDKRIDDLDFKELQFMGPGKTPDDIQEKCLILCKDYLSGNWCQQTVDTIEVRRITGGSVNQIYYCGIKNSDNSEGIPQEVAVRFYGTNNFDPDDKGKLKDYITSLIFSEKNLGPKIYGMFEGGLIQKYYKHRQFVMEEQKNPQLVQKVFRTMAQIHSLNMPIKKNPKPFCEIVADIYDEALKKFPIPELIQEHNLDTFQKYDMKSEIDWVKGVVQGLNSPRVFTHNDYRSSNLMITEKNELVVCDYDCCCYGPRGFDFASLMREWGRHHFEFTSMEGIAVEDQFRPNIEIYVEECERIHGKSWSQKPINSVDHILKEVKIFLMFSYLYFAVFVLSGKMGVEENEPPNLKFMMGFSHINFKNYISVKELLSRQNIFD